MKHFTINEVGNKDGHDHIGTITNVDLYTQSGLNSFEKRLIESCSNHYDFEISLKFDIGVLRDQLVYNHFSTTVKIGLGDNEDFTSIKETWLY